MYVEIVTGITQPLAGRAQKQHFYSSRFHFTNSSKPTIPNKLQHAQNILTYTRYLDQKNLRLVGFELLVKWRCTLYKSDYPMQDLYSMFSYQQFLLSIDKTTVSRALDPKHQNCCWQFTLELMNRILHTYNSPALVWNMTNWYLNPLTLNI